MKQINYFLAILVVATLTISSASALAQEQVIVQPWAAGIKISRGIVNIIRGDKTYPGRVGAKLKVDDTIVTGGNGSVGLVFLDNSTLTMGPESEVFLKRFNYDSTTYMGAFDAYVKQGTVSLQAGNLADSGPDNVRVTTPQAELKGNAKQLLISVGDNK
jgi:hypothetical protein